MADVGRPTVMTPEVIAKLEEAFSNDATDLQACFLAGISKDALYDYQKEYPEFYDRKMMLKGMTTYQAKINIKNKVMDGDVPTSQWLAERKEKQEYSTRSEHTGADGKDLPTPILAYVSSDNSNKEDTSTKQEN